MWKKCRVGWKGLNIFNNQIIFLCTGTHGDIQFHYLCGSVYTCSIGFIVLQKYFMNILHTCKTIRILISVIYIF